MERAHVEHTETRADEKLPRGSDCVTAGVLQNWIAFSVNINGSIKEVLSRTIVANLANFLVTAALCFLGVSVLFDFSLSLFIEIFIGTYFSIFIANPLVFI